MHTLTKNSSNSILSLGIHLDYFLFYLCYIIYGIWIIWLPLLYFVSFHQRNSRLMAHFHFVNNIFLFRMQKTTNKNKIHSKPLHHKHTQTLQGPITNNINCCWINKEKYTLQFCFRSHQKHRSPDRTKKRVHFVFLLFKHIGIYSKKLLTSSLCISFTFFFLRNFGYSLPLFCFQTNFFCIFLILLLLLVVS